MSEPFGRRRPLLRGEKSMGRPVRQAKCLVPVAERAREDVNPLPAHDPKLADQN